VLERAAQRDMPSLIPKLFSESRPAARHRRIEHFDDVTEATVTSTSSDAEGVLRPFPIQLDGDYIGEATALELRIAPGALTVVA
jgi:diacylglycerol kinase family enzyme